MSRRKNHLRYAPNVERVAIPVSSCGKRAYSSVEQARAASKRLSCRLFVYRCDECGAWHARNQDKHSDYTYDGS